MQCLGKLNGPECRIENIMDIFIFLSYSWFGLPFLSYYSSGHSYHYAWLKHSLNSYLESFKNSINGHVSFHGSQCQVTPVVFGGWFFRLSSKLSSSSHLYSMISFGMSMTSVPSIARGLSMIFLWIQFQEMNLKDDLENQMISIHFDIDVSIITLLLDRLHAPSDLLLSILPKVMSQFFMTVPSHTFSQTLRSFTAIKHITRVIMNPAASKSMRASIACQWHSILRSAIFWLLILSFRLFQECRLKDLSLLLWWNSSSLE